MVGDAPIFIMSPSLDWCHHWPGFIFSGVVGDGPIFIMMPSFDWCFLGQVLEQMMLALKGRENNVCFSEKYSEMEVAWRYNLFKLFPPLTLLKLLTLFTLFNRLWSKKSIQYTYTYCGFYRLKGF